VPRLLHLSLLALVTAVPLSAQQSHNYTIPGNDVVIYNLAGEVTVLGGSGGTVSVDVTTIGSDGARLTVENGDLRGHPTLRVLYPDDRIVYPALGRGNNTNFTIREDGTWSGSGESWRDRSDGRKVTIRGDGSGLEAAANLRITIPAGKRVSVYLGVGRIDASNIDGEIRLDAASADVTSRGSRGGLDIDTGSGNVTVQDASGRVSLDTGSGDVQITRMKDGDLKVDTGSGSVEGTGIAAAQATIETGSGDIRLDDLSAQRLSLEAGSGDVRATLKGALDLLHVETGSGNVTIHLPEDIGATVDLDTGSGEFNLDFPLQLTRKSEGNLRGRLGDGRGRIEIETGSGDIALVK
jgi:hypothetical protein